MSDTNEPRTKEITLVECYGNSYMEDSLDVEFLLADLPLQLSKAKAQGYTTVKLHVRRSYDSDIEFQLVGTRSETPREVSARVANEAGLRKQSAVATLRAAAAALTREEVLAAWEAGQQSKKEG